MTAFGDKLGGELKRPWRLLQLSRWEVTSGQQYGHWGDSGKILEVEPIKLVDGVHKCVYEREGSRKTKASGLNTEKMEHPLIGWRRRGSRFFFLGGGVLAEVLAH